MQGDCQCMCVGQPAIQGGLQQEEELLTGHKVLTEVPLAKAAGQRP